jgi:hypothetical protein
MNFKPFINPDLDLDGAVDQLKYLYYALSPMIAKLQFRLGELAVTGKMNTEECLRLQDDLLTLWEELYINTQSFTRDDAHDDGTTPDSDEYYSDGRRICIKIHPRNDQAEDDHWPVLGDGAIAVFPYGTSYFVRTPSDHDETVPGPDKFSTMTIGKD